MSGAKPLRIALVGDGRRPGVRDAVESMVEAIHSGEGPSGLEIVVTDLEGDAELPATVELLVVYGGDGTLLHAAHRLADREIPVLGVNLGRLGFLAEFETAEADEALAGVVSGELTPSRMLMLHWRLEEEDGAVSAEGYALNDAVFSRRLVGRMVHMTVDVDGEEMADYAGDGLIVSTPAGSTAHSLSAGGPVLHPAVDGVVVSPICPHSLSSRPVVLPCNREIRVTPADHRDHRQELLCTVDGRWTVTLHRGRSMVLQQAGHDFLIVRNPKVEYFERLRNKLFWSGTPNYGRPEETA